MKDLLNGDVPAPLYSQLYREVSLSQCSIYALDGSDCSVPDPRLPDLSAGKYVDNRPTEEEFEMEVANRKVQVTKQLYLALTEDRELEDMLGAKQSLDLTQTVRSAENLARRSVAPPVAKQVVALDPFEERQRKENQEILEAYKERMTVELEQADRDRRAAEEELDNTTERRATKKLRFAPNTVFRQSKKKVLSSESIIFGCTGEKVEETLAGPDSLPPLDETVGKYLTELPSSRVDAATSTEEEEETPKRPHVFNRLFNAVRGSFRRNS